MIFLSGPRQVGKTTLAKTISSQHPGLSYYLTWDDLDQRRQILKGADSIAEQLDLSRQTQYKPILVFDELHKYKHWKTLLKGFFDRFEQQVHIIVTGSAQLNIFKKGGDSLMGRYFNYHLHPLSAGELLPGFEPEQLLQSPRVLAVDDFEQLLRYGGFPEPFLKASQRFTNRWQHLRREQLIREDIRDSARVQELGQMEVLSKILQEQTGQVTRYTTLATQIRVSVDTIRRWLDILEAFYFCFRIRPWHQNISSALRKDPKTYLWDWSIIQNPGARAENLIACHLLKACHWWTDRGFGQFDLYYLRTKDQKEVDFLVSKDQQPWFLVEVKHAASAKLNPHLGWFQQQTDAEHAFQVDFTGEAVAMDCFSYNKPVKLAASSLLGQLV
ncbi:ATP-binding protein [Candidatus Venteria ishoeyi]|uniref:ATP-binding protein n=1 Tax=Candidatus Venteria ishoeyi TaxID=1899563 RepID=UPI0025A66653|nr:ATP-binding protein [Candidatus Venteria ishoeyi]MDM8548098.1 ATP-binding protein [Candidatus Venteria ishoeyi]